jgi:hypothetical protein
MKRILRNENGSDFFREGSYRQILIVSGSDDSSQESAEYYANVLFESVVDPGMALGTGAVPATASKLLAFSELVSRYEPFQDIEDHEFSGLIYSHGTYHPPRPACISSDILDTEPEREGLQVDCSVTLNDNSLDDDETPLPLLTECDNESSPRSSANRPCYYIEENLVACAYGSRSGWTMDVAWDHVIYRNGVYVEARCAAIGTTK